MNNFAIKCPSPVTLIDPFRSTLCPFFLQDLVVLQLPGEVEFLLTPVVVRENDTSATSIDEWTGDSLATCANVCICACATYCHSRRERTVLVFRWTFVTAPALRPCHMFPSFLPNFGT